MTMISRDHWTFGAQIKPAWELRSDGTGGEKAGIHEC